MDAQHAEDQERFPLGISRSFWIPSETITLVSRCVLRHRSPIGGRWLLITVLAIATMSLSFGNLKQEISIPDTELATVEPAYPDVEVG
jgi:hypothetical protein